VESNLHPHFLFTNFTIFLFAIFPTSQPVTILSLPLRTFSASKLRVPSESDSARGCFTPLSPFLLKTALKKVRTFFFFTGQT
jgi:hypothetical protein